MVFTFHRDLRDLGRHRPYRALADRHQARTYAAGGELVGRDHDRGDGNIRDDVDSHRDRAVRCRTPVDSRCMGPVASTPTQIEHGSETAFGFHRLPYRIEISAYRTADFRLISAERRQR